MLQLRILAPNTMTDEVVGILEEDPCVSGLVVVPGAAIRPAGDLVLADIAREAANDIIDRLRAVGLHKEGTIEIQPVSTWLSRSGFDAEVKAPGSSADTVVWAEVAQRSYEETELNWSFLTFLTLATVIAAIAIVLDSQILVIGAMVLGPEFGAIAALGVALVRRRFALLALATRTLILGFMVAIAVTTVLALIGRALGWITLDDVIGPRPATAFIYTPDKWSFIVAVIAATAGVLSLTSRKAGAMTRCLHLGDHGAGRRQHRVGNCLRRRLRDLGQHSPAAREHIRYGAGRLGRAGIPAGGVVEGVCSPREGDDPAEANAVR